MKRVAFFLQPNPSAWIGGLNYLRNLLTAIRYTDDSHVEPVLFIHPEVDQANIIDFPSIEVIRTPLVDPKHPIRLAGRLLYKIFKKDFALEALLVKHNIDILSHSGITGKSSRVVSIGWIPDFQHLRMPHYFSARELKIRNNQFRKLIAGSHRIIVSSFDARRDLEAFLPSSLDSSRVLQFVSCVTNVSPFLSREELALKYKIDRPYFHLPNQFWPHKNHSVVIDALEILNARGFDILVLATGSTTIYKGSAYFDSVMERVKSRGVAHNFRSLGVVSSIDLLSLMIHSVSLINPSNFEGWSTSVEESKSLGLPILLSDIPVHLEQAPSLGHFFQVDSAEDLADKLILVLDQYDAKRASQARETALSELPSRIIKFGKAFEEIAIQACIDPRR